MPQQFVLKRVHSVSFFRGGGVCVCTAIPWGMTAKMWNSPRITKGPPSRLTQGKRHTAIGMLIAGTRQQLVVEIFDTTQRVCG